MQRRIRETPSSVREWPLAARLGLTRATLVVLAGSALLLTVSGGFGLQEIRLDSRAIFIALAILACAVTGGCIDFACRLHRLSHRPFLKALVRVVLHTGPSTLICWSIAVAMYGPGRGLPELVEAFINVAAATVAIASVRALVKQNQPAAAAKTSQTGNIPLALRARDILAVEAQDHYIRIHTPHGSSLIKMRFADALTGLASRDGAQTHRSWWVARGAVRMVSRGDGRAMLTLSNDISVPVSRRFAPVLRDAGWY